MLKMHFHFTHWEYKEPSFIWKQFQKFARVLFHDLLSAPMFHYSVWSVLTAHNLTPAKRDVTTVVSDQRSRFNRVSTIDDYNTPRHCGQT